MNEKCKKGFLRIFLVFSRVEEKKALLKNTFLVRIKEKV